MPIEVRVPQLGESVVEATIARWLKGTGEAVAAGDDLAELETDKVNQHVAAESAGVLREILHPEGATVHPGDLIAVIAEGAPAAAPTNGSSAGAAAPEAAQPAPAQPAPAPAAPAAEETRATPLAQRVAAERNIDLSGVSGSGPGGRITREDVELHARAAAIPPKTGSSPPPAPAAAPPAPASPSAAAPPPPAAPARRPASAAPEAAGAAAPAAASPSRPETRQRLSRRRLTIARRLVEAQQTAAMLTTFNEVDLTAVMEIRKRRRDAFKEQHGVGLGFMSFFCKAVIGALKNFPPLNAEMRGEDLILKHYFDLGIAVAAEEGLVVPVIRDADRLTFAGIEQKIGEYAARAREGSLTVDELRGGTFTITNGGVFGSLLSTPILNPPQVGILGMHRIQDRPVALNGEVVIRPMMYLALTYDHRVIDGREAVQFLVRVRELLEDPERLLLEA